MCRDIDDIYLLSRLRIRSEYHYILASDDIRVHKVVKKYHWVSDVSWIDQMESFYHVANDVIKFLDVVNQWLESLGDDKCSIPKELLFWIRHCEGVMTTQRIQDALLLIRSHLQLLETYHIGSVVILCHPGMHWEDDVLIQTAKSRGINVWIIGCSRTSVLIGKIATSLKAPAKEFYSIFRFIRVKLRNCFEFRNDEISDKEIVFQLCSSAYKHVENILSIMKALKNISYNPVALCWQAYKGAEQVREEGLQVEELEKWTPISSIWSSTFLSYQAWKRAMAKRQQFLAHPELQYQGVSLGSLLWPSVKYFFGGELAQRYRYFLGIKKYLDSHFPLAIKLWGGGILIEGDIVVKYLKRRENRPLFFYYFWVFFDDPYDSQMEYIDLFLATGELQKKYLERLGVASNKIALVGMSRYDHIWDFRKYHSKEQSLSYLNIPSIYSIFILYDPNVILRGYLTISEQAQVTEFLLDFAKKHSSMALLIKPHPSHSSGMVESLISSYSLQNVFLIDKSMLPYHVLNVADFLITKFSTIGIEAMIFECPIISVLLDSEERFKIYEDAAEYITTVADLNKLLIELVNNASIRFQWTRKQIEKQKLFLKNFLGENTQNSSIIAANEINSFLEKQKFK